MTLAYLSLLGLKTIFPLVKASVELTEYFPVVCALVTANFIQSLPKT